MRVEDMQCLVDAVYKAKMDDKQTKEDYREKADYLISLLEPAYLSIVRDGKKTVTAEGRTTPGLVVSWPDSFSGLTDGTVDKLREIFGDATDSLVEKECKYQLKKDVSIDALNDALGESFDDFIDTKEGWTTKDGFASNLNDIPEDLRPKQQTPKISFKPVK